MIRGVVLMRERKEWGKGGSEGGDDFKASILSLLKIFSSPGISFRSCVTQLNSLSGGNFWAFQGEYDF